MSGAGSIGGTITNGIQDISALLPLLGTEQCEEHLGSALTKGFLYAAATPLSIFGSLGMARAGFKVLLASISIPRWSFVGAQTLRDAGFKPSGKNLELIMMDPNKEGCYLAETRLNMLPPELEDAAKVGLRAEAASGTWNLKMTFWTAVLCFMGLVPYIHLSLSENTLPLSTRLAFPLIRIVGGFLVAASSQILIQRKLIAILNHPLSFRTLDPLVKSAFPNHDWWDSKAPPEVCLWRLQNHLEDTRVLPLHQRLFRAFSTRFSVARRWLNRHQYTDEEKYQVEDPVDAERKEALDPLKTQFNKRIILSNVLWPFIVSNTIGICASVVGYVGCFSVVQGAIGSKAPVIWLCLETLLSIIRVALWSWNPICDDLDPITFVLDLSPDLPTPTYDITVRDIADSTRDNPVFIPEVDASTFYASVTSYAGFFERFNRPDSAFVLMYTLFREPKELGEGTRWVLYITFRPLSDSGTRPYIYGPRYGVSGFVMEYRFASYGWCSAGYRTIVPEEYIVPEEHALFRDNPSLREDFERHYWSILDHLQDRDDKSRNIGYPYGRNDKIDVLWTISMKAVDRHRSLSQVANDSWRFLDTDILTEEVRMLQNQDRLFSLRLAWLESYMNYIADDRTNHMREINARLDTPLHGSDIERYNDEEWFSMHLIVLEEMKEWERRLAIEYTETMGKVIAQNRDHSPGPSCELIMEHLARRWSVAAQRRSASRNEQIQKSIDEYLDDRCKSLVDSIQEMWLNLSLDIEKLDSLRNTSFPPSFFPFPHSYEKDLRDAMREAYRRVQSEQKESRFRLQEGLEGVNPLSDTDMEVLVRWSHSRCKWLSIDFDDIPKLGASLSRVLKRHKFPVFAVYFTSVPNYRLADDVIAGALKSIHTQSLTSISFGSFIRLPPAFLAVLEEMVIQTPNLICEYSGRVLVPIPQVTLPAGQHHNPNRFTTFCFQRFNYTYSECLLGDKFSRLELRFVGPMEGGLVIWIHHRSEYEEQQMELHRKDNNFMSICPVSQSDTFFVGKISLFPDVHFDRGILNHIYLQPTSRGYRLRNIDLLDEHGNRYRYEGDDVDEDENEDRNGDDGDDNTEGDLENGGGQRKESGEEGDENEKEGNDEENKNVVSQPSEVVRGTLSIIA